jgi:hypothetical protein
LANHLMTAEQHALVAQLSEAAGFAEDDALAIRKRPHNDSADRMIELAPTFEVLSTPVLPKGSVKAIAAVVSIPYGAIRDWRLKLSADPGWRPYEDHN